MSDLWALSATELVAGYRAREFTPVEVIDSVGVRIEALDGLLGAFTTLCLDRARDEAAALRPDDQRPLAGVPFGAKDLLDSAGVRTTYGSALFAEHVPSVDAAAIASLRAAGALLVGKTQTHEFAWGITSVNPSIGSSHNPWDPQRIPGGSSGGSGVALAARMVPLALGTDTGGSIRIPAAFCGVMGFKPTYGRIDVAGAWPLAPSLDHVGVMARTPDDLELLYRALIASELPGDGREVVCAQDDLEWACDAFDVFAVVQAVEAARVHAGAGLFPDRAGEYGADVRQRLERAVEVDPLAYVDAARRREELRGRFAQVLAGGALLETPVATVPPPRPQDTATLRGMVMPHTTPQNLAGLPACSVRRGFDDDGLPIATQITGAAGDDAGVLRAARRAYEAAGSAVQDAWPL